MTKNSRQKLIYRENEELLRWNKKHFSPLLNAFIEAEKTNFFRRWKSDLKFQINLVSMNRYHTHLLACSFLNFCYSVSGRRYLSVMFCLYMKKSANFLPFNMFCFFYRVVLWMLYNHLSSCFQFCDHFKLPSQLASDNFSKSLTISFKNLDVLMISSQLFTTVPHGHLNLCQHLAVWDSRGGIWLTDFRKILNFVMGQT